MLLDEIKKNVTSIAETILRDLTFELFEVDVKRRNKDVIIDVLADKPEGGITVDQCTQINRKLSDEIEIQNFIADHYIVEVSSPGLDRPLISEKDFLRVKGRVIRVHLSEPIEAKMELTGTVEDILRDSVLINSNTKTVEIPIIKITKAVQEIPLH